MLRSARLVAALALLVTLWPAAAFAQTRAGVVTNLEGSATAARSAAPQPVALKFKDDVFQNDRIVTGDRSIVRMLLGGKAVVTVRERSSLTITEVPGKSTIDLDVGKIAVAVARERMKPGEQIEVKTPNAVAAVRGTVFIIEVIRATAQVTPGGVPGGVTTNSYWYGGTGTMTFGTTVLNMTGGNFASGLGLQPPTFVPVMSQQLSNQGAAGLGLQGQNMAAGRQGSNEQSMGVTVATFTQGAGLPQVAGGDTPPQPVIDNRPPPVILQGCPPNCATTTTTTTSPSLGTGILIFGAVDPFNEGAPARAALAATLAALKPGTLITNLSTSSPPADLSAYGTIWSVGLNTQLSSPVQSQLAGFLARGGGVYLTGEKPCTLCEQMNATVQPLVRSVVVGGDGIQVGGLGDFFSGYNFPFNASAKGNISAHPNMLTTWAPDAPGGIGGISGSNIFVSAVRSIISEVLTPATPIGAVWGSSDLVGGVGKLVLLMDVDWLYEVSENQRRAIVENILDFLDDPPAPLVLNGPLFRSTNEQFDTATTFFNLDGANVTGLGTNPLVWLTGTRVATSGNFLRATNSQISAAGTFARLENGAEIVQTSSGEALMWLQGGSLAAGTGGAGNLFELSGRPGHMQVDGDTGLTLGTDRPLQPGTESPVFEATNGAAVTVAGSAYRVDTALLEATAPLLNLVNGASLTTGAHTVDLVAKARVSLPNDAVAMINLHGAALTVTNGNLVNVAGGSQLNIAGSLLSLSGGSTVNILNGLLLNVTGGSNVTIGTSLVSFSGSGNLLNVTNSFAPTAIIGGIPVYGLADNLRVTSPNALAGLGAAGTIRINGVTLTPTTPLSSLTGSLVAIQGNGSKVKVGN
jgi:hypothetical protein